MNRKPINFRVYRICHLRIRLVILRALLVKLNYSVEYFLEVFQQILFKVLGHVSFHPGKREFRCCFISRNLQICSDTVINSLLIITRQGGNKIKFDI